MNPITFNQVEAWLGSDISRFDLIDMLQDIANGIYRVEQLQGDIRSWIEESEDT
jgi:hypothetical protein